jgi:hypothetical protein
MSASMNRQEYLTTRIKSKNWTIFNHIVFRVEGNFYFCPLVDFHFFLFQVILRIFFLEKVNKQLWARYGGAHLLFPVLRKLWQEDCEVKASYIVRLCLKKTNNNKK